MKFIFIIITWIALNAVTAKQTNGQCMAWHSLKDVDSVFTNPAFGITTTVEADRLRRPYVYLATVSGGIKIYDSNSSVNPILVSTVPKTSLSNLDAINLLQDSIWLYVCLGNIWDTTELSGLAIIDVQNPLFPIVLDVYMHPGLKGGSGAVVVKGNYAYVAANQNGLIILDIGNKRNIQVQQVLPLRNNFPHSVAGSSSLYNARGIDIQGQYAYICYDRGGLRIVDISNVHSPFQTNQYCFSPLIDKATAYNNVVIHKNLAFVSIDYYGLEILDISSPDSIYQVGWWHPHTWADTTNNFTTWANSNGHANELAYDSICEIVYVAAGKSDVVAIDVSNPKNPVTCQTYGSTADAFGTWGLDFFNHTLHIAYIWSPIAPPYSNYTGFKIFQTNCNATYINENGNNSLMPISIFPNPTFGKINIDVNDQKLKSIKICNPTGELLQEYFTSEFSIADFPSGVYFVITQTDQFIFQNTCIKY